jgi:hypothetical protein
MKKTFTLTLILLFGGASLFAQNPHHKKDGHKEIKKEYKHHHKNKTVVIQPIAPKPPSVVIRFPSVPRPPSVNVQLPSPPPPPRPPR